MSFLLPLAPTAGVAKNLAAGVVLLCALTACGGAQSGGGAAETAGGGIPRLGGGGALTALSITPDAQSLPSAGTLTFAAEGGVEPYAFAVTSGGGTIDAETGEFVAPTGPATVEVSVTDNLGGEALATLQIAGPLVLTPAPAYVVIGGTVALSSSGGLPPLNYTLVSGAGSAAGSSYTAGLSAGSAVMRVTDSLGTYADSTVTTVTPVSISPTHRTLVVNGTGTFSGAGGLLPYSYSLVSGAGAISTMTGVYTADASPGVAVVRVTDALGQTADASVTINAVLEISPATPHVVASGSVAFSATGGQAPLVYAVLSGGGSINSTTGLYTAPALAGVATVRVTDAAGQMSDASVTIVNALSITPLSVTLSVGNSATFSGTGGLAPYSFAVQSGGGSVNASTGVYTAPGSAGSATVRVTDALGQTADATVTITAALAIAPSSPPVVPSGSLSFVGTNGVPPYVYSVQSGGGSVNASTGLYTAPGATGSATVRVTDSLSNVADALVTIVGPVVIAPASATLAAGNSASFSASGGAAPYVYDLAAGGGSIDASTGTYTAPGSAGSATVRVTDALGQTSTATVTINAALAISPVSADLIQGGTQTFSAAGGVVPYTFSVLSGGGSVDASTGVYTAPGTAGGVTVRVSDSLGNTADASITVHSAVSISPATLTLAVNNTHSFTSSGGQAAFAYSIVSGGGSIDAVTGAFTAPGTAGTVTVRVTDQLGQTSDAAVTVNAALAISPSTLNMVRNGTQTFTSTGGVGAKTYSVASGGGSINSSTGAYTAPGTAGSATIRVTDALGNTSDSAVTIVGDVMISPASAVLAVNNTQAFTGSAGLAPYTYSRPTGTGSVNSSTGLYTAPASSGSATVRVTDALGQTATATVTINAALAISPTTENILTNGSRTFSGTGGVPPRVFSVVSGGGSIHSSTGAFTAPGTPSTVVVRVTDAVSNTADATVTVVNPVVISPTTLALADGNVQTFTATGGDGDYTFSVESGLGTVDSSTGEYAAGGEGSDVVRVTDGLGFFAEATVTVEPLPVVDPATLTLAATDTHVFTTAGGVAPLVYSVQAGGGSIDASSGEFTAPGAPGSATVRVTDALGNFSEAVVTVVAGVTIAPASRSIPVNRTVVFTSAGGVGPYTYSIVSGGGSIDSSTGSYTSPATAQNVVVRVTDTLMNTSESLVEVVTPVRVYSGASAAFNCLKFSNARIKCWGANGSGRLGVGGSGNRGDGANEMFEALPYVNLGAGFAVDHVSLGSAHACAVSTAGVVKCWGANTYGQLGYGDVVARGATALSMGDALAPVDLGVGRTAIQVAAGQNHNCALLDDSTIKCWGRNNVGQLGQGNTTTQGDGVGEMGDDLAVTSLSTTATPTAIYAGFAHNCASLSDGTQKCWGSGGNGRLGQGNTTTRGDGAGEMGNSLAVTDLGAGVSADFMAPANNFTCARMGDGSAKCWGRNNAGQLLKGSTATLGDSAAEMGAGLTAMNFGTGRTVVEIQSGSAFSCAQLDDNSVKCWGSAASGALGNGSTTAHLGDAVGELGGGLPVVSLGTAQSISNIAVGSAHACVLFTDHTLKCWGLNSSGQLGLGNTNTRGDAAGEMGASLPFVTY